jgi:major membrane immunogen (membrane-anchored lipoprotein)
MKKAGIAAAAGAVVLSMALAGCGGGSSKAVSYNDGTYEGKSEVHESLDESGEDTGNGYGVVSITIKDGVITDCKFDTYEPDGTYKDDQYGMKEGAVANRDYYNKAQKANAAREEYASMLVANGSLDGIDAISGATINFEEFTEAVEDALTQAAAE